MPYNTEDAVKCRASITSGICILVIQVQNVLWVKFVRHLNLILQQSFNGLRKIKGQVNNEKVSSQNLQFFMPNSIMTQAFEMIGLHISKTDLRNNFTTLSTPLMRCTFRSQSINPCVCSLDPSTWEIGEKF